VGEIITPEIVEDLMCEAFVEHWPNKTKIAKMAGCTRQTVYNWEKKELFMLRVRKESAEKLKTAAQIREYMVKQAGVLGDKVMTSLLDDKSALTVKDRVVLGLKTLQLIGVQAPTESTNLTLTAVISPETAKTLASRGTEAFKRLEQSKDKEVSTIVRS